MGFRICKMNDILCPKTYILERRKKKTCVAVKNGGNLYEIHMDPSPGTDRHATDATKLQSEQIPLTNYNFN